MKTRIDQIFKKFLPLYKRNMQVSKTKLKLRSLIMYHKNSTYRIFKDQNNEKHERKIIFPPLLCKKTKQDFLHAKKYNMIINAFNK